MLCLCALGVAASLSGCTPRVEPQPVDATGSSIAWVGPEAIVLWDETGERRFALRPDDPAEALRALRKHRAMNGTPHASAARAPVVVGLESARALDVLATVGGLLDRCEQPVRVRLRAGEPAVPLMPVTVHGCRAKEPVRYCSAVRFEVSKDWIEVTHSALPVGANCPHGAHAVLRSPAFAQRGRTPPAPPVPSSRRFDRGEPITNMLRKPAPHAGLEDCPDTFVRFRGHATPWGTAKAFLAGVDGVWGARITFDVTTGALAARAQCGGKQVGALCMASDVGLGL